MNNVRNYMEMIREVYNTKNGSTLGHLCAKHSISSTTTSVLKKMGYIAPKNGLHGYRWVGPVISTEAELRDHAEKVLRETSKAKAMYRIRGKKSALPVAQAALPLHAAPRKSKAKRVGLIRRFINWIY